MPIEDDIALLDRVPLLQLLGREGLRVIAISAESHALGPGEVLFSEGQPADAAYVVMTGRLALSREDPAFATRPGHSAVVGPGALLGELALITETKRPCTATALEACVLLRVPRIIFMRTVESYPDAAVRLASALSQQMSGTLGELDGVRRRLEALDGPFGRR
ncbi:MAG TPA: cyclic nucleotide-binding domain-containing protein [Ancylobacter sp.]